MSNSLEPIVVVGAAATAADGPPPEPAETTANSGVGVSSVSDAESMLRRPSTPPKHNQTPPPTSITITMGRMLDELAATSNKYAIIKGSNKRAARWKRNNWLENISVQILQVETDFSIFPNKTFSCTERPSWSEKTKNCKMLTISRAKFFSTCLLTKRMKINQLV